MLRWTVQNELHVVVIHKSGDWGHHYLPSDGSEYQSIQERTSSNIRTGRDVENHVRVVASGNKGWLFINGIYEAELDLSGLTDSGSVGLIGAWFDEDELPGHTTPFSGFTVRPLEGKYGPTDGALDHDPESGSIDEHDTLTLLVDGIVETRFFNPYSAQEGPWSSGFLIRNSGVEEFHAIVITDAGWWYHDLRTGDADSTQELAEDFSSDISTSPSGSNHIRIIALGGEGWLFINGSYVDKLDLTGWLEEGGVSAVASYFEGDGIAGRSTRFEGLTIWFPIDPGNWATGTSGLWQNPSGHPWTPASTGVKAQPTSCRGAESGGEGRSGRGPGGTPLFGISEFGMSRSRPRTSRNPYRP